MIHDGYGLRLLPGSQADGLGKKQKFQFHYYISLRFVITLYSVKGLQNCCGNVTWNQMNSQVALVMIPVILTKG